LITKKFINFVLPGLTDVLDSVQLFVSVFISDDLPTFDLPIIANSGKSDIGHSSNFDALFTKTALDIIIRQRKQ
jgi:GTP-binding protein EngB required for normal cell division